MTGQTYEVLGVTGDGEIYAKAAKTGWEWKAFGSKDY